MALYYIIRLHSNKAAGLAKSVTILATSNSKEQASDAVSSDTVKKLQSQIPDLQIRQVINIRHLRLIITGLGFDRDELGGHSAVY